MINPKMIPPEAVEAACRAYTSIMLDIAPELAISEAIAAALAAWPGALWSPDEVIDGETLPPIVSLPFQQETSDAES